MKFQSLPKVLVALFVTSIFSIAFYSCKEEAVPKQEMEQRQIKEVTVENGRLKFADEAHFKDVFNSLMKNQNPIFLSNWESKFQNYTSMKKAYLNLTDDDKLKIAETKSNKGFEGFLTIIQNGEEIEAIKNTEHPIYSIMFNKEGLVLIGNNAYKFEYNRILKLKDYNSNKIDALNNGKITNEVQVIPLRISKVPIFNNNAKVRDIDDLDRECHSMYSNNKAFAAYFTLYGQAEVNLFGWNVDFDGSFDGYFALAKHRKRFLGVWFNSDTQSLRLTGQFLFYNGSSNQLVNIDSGTCNDCSEQAAAYFWGGSYPATGWVKSSGTDYDYNYHECQVSK